MLTLNIQNETGKLESVVLGIAKSFGGTPALEDCYDPKSREHVKAGTFPDEGNLIPAMESFCAVLEKHEVQVYRPSEIKGLNQIFSRDIAFVIEDKIILPNIIKDRAEEIKALQYLIDQIPQEYIIKMPEDARAEGGDVMPWNEFIFIGYSEEEDFNQYQSARTNKKGVDFLGKVFPDKKIKAFELKKSDSISSENALHLDCCLQPIAKNQAIIYREGFKNLEDVRFIENYFGKKNIIEITKEEMGGLHSNIFSISPNVIVSERSFTRLNTELRSRGFTVEEINYNEIAKMGGLLRCSTMPLKRKK